MVPSFSRLSERTSTDSPLFDDYQKQRRAHWNSVARSAKQISMFAAFYRRLIEKYYKFFVPKGLRVIELGCGRGDLLAALSPSYGVGIDLSDVMIEQARSHHPELSFYQGDAHAFRCEDKFDVIILSDLLNDVWDVQSIIENLRHLAHRRTRVVANSFNNMWRLPLSVARFLGLANPVLDQNWFSNQDTTNLLSLSGFEEIKRYSCILFPLPIPIVAGFCNRWLAQIPPFRWLCLTNFSISRLRPTGTRVKDDIYVSVVIPARNEAGHIEDIIKRTPGMADKMELIFVEGGSEDDTYETIEQTIKRFPELDCSLYKQTGIGKGDAVRLGFEKAKGNILLILDADMTVPPESLPRFVHALSHNGGEFVNGVRLVYPMQEKAMRYFNIVGNKFFSLAFSWLLGQPIKDTLCGTKALWRSDYRILADNRSYFGEFDPFGDFDLIFGAAKLNLKIVDLPIRYQSRCYGDTNINRWKHGLILLRMLIFASRKIKFI